MPSVEKAILNPNASLSVGDALMVAVCGLLVVFMMLAILAVVIMVIVLFFRQGLMGDKELPDKLRDWKAKLQRRKEKKKEAVK